MSNGSTGGRINEYAEWAGIDPWGKAVKESLVMKNFVLGKPPTVVEESEWAPLSVYIPQNRRLDTYAHLVDRGYGHAESKDYFRLRMHDSYWPSVTKKKIDELRFVKDTENGIAILKSTTQLSFEEVDGWKVSGFMKICRVPLDDGSYKYCAYVDVVKAGSRDTYHVAWCWPN